MRSPKLGCFRSCSWYLWKALEEEGCIGLVSWRLDLRCKSSWILNDFFIEVCLFCLYLWNPLNWDALDHVLDLFGKLSRRRGASAWFHGVWTCSVEVLEYWMISSLKIKLNRSWKFRRNWNVPLVLLERSRWAGFDGIYLVIFGFRMWEILIFKWFLRLKIQINSKKPSSGRKHQLRMW
jgi:hypothetical protein